MRWGSRCVRHPGKWFAVIMPGISRVCLMNSCHAAVPVYFRIFICKGLAHCLSEAGRVMGLADSIALREPSQIDGNISKNNGNITGSRFQYHDPPCFMGAKNVPTSFERLYIGFRMPYSRRRFREQPVVGYDDVFHVCADAGQDRRHAQPVRRLYPVREENGKQTSEQFGRCHSDDGELGSRTTSICRGCLESRYSEMNNG